MKKITLLVLVLISSFLINTNAVYAEEDIIYECSADEIARLKDIASQITIEYEYVGDIEDEDGNIIHGGFNVNISGLTEEVMIETGVFTTISYEETYQGVTILNNYTEGEYTFKIYGMGICHQVLRTIYLSIPNFNEYSLDERCEGIETKEFIYCDPWYQFSIDEETFNLKLEEYYNKLYEEYLTKQDDLEQDNILDIKENNIISFLKKNYAVIISLVIIISMIIIFIILYRKRRRRNNIYE
ncbi:MAG: hypothetical protein Q4G04_00360 [bacterium]|nr:hypothetical protein [bacterium]